MWAGRGDDSPPPPRRGLSRFVNLDSDPLSPAKTPLKLPKTPNRKKSTSLLWFSCLFGFPVEIQPSRFTAHRLVVVHTILEAGIIASHSGRQISVFRGRRETLWFFVRKNRQANLQPN